MSPQVSEITSEEFRIAFDSTPSPAMILDRDLIILACNIAYEGTAHMKRESITGRPAFEVFPGSDFNQKNLLFKSFTRVLESGKPHHIPHMQYATADPNGSGYQERHWTVSNIPLLREDGTLLGILHCPADITELTQLRQANQIIQGSGLDVGAQEDIQRWTRNVKNILHIEQERLNKLFQQAPGFICVLEGPHFVFELANDAYYQLVGHRSIIGQRLAEVMPEVVGQGYLEILDRVFTTGEPFIGRAMPIELQRVEGDELALRYMDLIYQPMIDDDGRVARIFVQGNDVTETYTLTQEIAHQAAHDSLTGLRNRRDFARRTQKIDGPGPHALLYMDIDHFKIVNDRCGHAAGDDLLMKVAEVLTSQCDDERDILARVGGDEFAWIRRNCSPSAAFDLANRLRREIKDINFMWQGKCYGITLSVGVASFGESERLTFELALPLADAACFLAKERGRDRVQVGSLADEDVRQQQQDMDNVTRLKEALREDRIVLYVQKIFGLQDGQNERHVYYEVLARLQNTDGTIIAPSGFIPAAERFGLIEQLDRHILCKTLAHLQASSREHTPGTCHFINLSGITLSAPGCIDFIESAIAACPAVRSSQICFEITETAALSNIQRTAEVMRRLVDKGVSVQSTHLEFPSFA